MHAGAQVGFSLPAPTSVERSGAIWLATLLCATSSRADEMPLIQPDGAASTPLGTWSLRAWAKRDAFPKVAQVAEMKAAGGVAGITAKAGGASFLSHGRASFDAKFDWAPLLLFTPRASGSYALGGRLKLSTNFSGPDPAQAQTAWAVVRWKQGEKAFAGVQQGREAKGAEVDFGAQPRLGAIGLGAGESVGLAVWRPSWHWSGYGELRDFSITPSTARDMARLDALLQSEQDAAAREEASSDVLPWQELAKQTEAEAKWGTWALLGARGRDNIAADGATTAEVRDVIEAGGVGPRWRTPGAAGFAVEAGRLSFHTDGRAGFGPKWDWLPLLRWTPKAPGTYKVSGTLDLRASKNSDDAQKPDAVAWAVLRLKADGSAQAVAHKRLAQGGQVLLGEQAALGSIALGEGESLALAVWRPAWHWSAGGTVSGLRIGRAST